MLALHIGAGNIGRGFIGELLSDAGYTVVFADVNDQLVQQIQEQGQYDVILAGKEERKKQITGVDAVNSLNEKERLFTLMAEADIITTAVGPNILPHIAPDLAKGLVQRLSKQEKPINVIACENMVGGTEALKADIFTHLNEEDQQTINQWVGFPNAAVDRIVPNQPKENELNVLVEPYFEWVVEKPKVKGDLPQVSGITYVDDLNPYIERKLFTVNTGHAALAYHGFAKGKKTIKEAIENESILNELVNVLAETGQLLKDKYGFTTADHKKYTDQIIERFKNPALSDPVSRVGRTPIRKLGSEERLVSPALQLTERGYTPEALASVIAAALYFRDEDDDEARQLQTLVDQKGPVQAFADIANLTIEHALVQLVEKSL